jgi:membrane protein required for colicin V production
VTRVDLLLAVVLLLFALRGLWRGFLREAFGLVGILAGAVTAVGSYQPLSEAIVTRWPMAPQVADLLAGGAIFVGVVLAASLLGRLARRLARAIWLGTVDRTVGVAFGLAKGMALVGLGVIAVQRFAPGSEPAHWLDGSRLARPLADLANRLVDAVRPFAPQPLEQRS